MENATKALLIAAAILITIIIISIGIAVVNQGVDTQNRGADKLNEAETLAFNTPFESYTRGNQTANQVKQLISAINSHNISENSSGKERYIGIYSTLGTTAAWYGYQPTDVTGEPTEPKAISGYNPVSGKPVTSLTVTSSRLYKITGYKSSIGLYYAFKIEAV